MEAIRATDLSKVYQLGERGANSLRDLLTSATRRGKVKRHDLWALKGVSFELAEGEVLGLIGRNGAGKSTLLKILSRITRPTSGKAMIRGRVGSLLEVGTGFHSELTGRENVYLNGAILGMKRAEIDKKFDEIVAFSEIGEFLDTPAKHYSSGMYMRLAFSVAAHLEPDVLIVDEVLAVGDIGFQKKCLGKMDEVRRSGRTVVFVSHNLGSLAQICERGILLDHGQLRYDGSIRGAIEEYLSMLSSESQVEIADTAKDIAITSATVTHENGRPAAEFFHDEAFSVVLRGRVRQHRRGAMFCVALLNKYKQRVFTEHKVIEELLDHRTDEFSVAFRIPGSFIAPNHYSFLIQIFTPDGEIMQELNDVCSLQVLDGGTDMVSHQDYGDVLSRGEWHVG